MKGVHCVKFLLLFGPLIVSMCFVVMPVVRLSYTFLSLKSIWNKVFFLLILLKDVGDNQVNTS